MTVFCVLNVIFNVNNVHMLL